MNKNIFKITSVLLFLLLVVVYVIIDKTYVKEERNSELFYVQVGNLGELEKVAPLAIRGEKIGKSEYVTEKSGEEFNYYTFTTIKVNEVLNNGTEQEVKVGDEIKVWEPYKMIDNGILPGKTKVNYGEYTEILEDKEYVLFMEWYPQGYYSLGPLEQGKYDLTDSDQKTARIMDGNVEYQKIKEEILEKYGN